MKDIMLRALCKNSFKELENILKSKADSVIGIVQEKFCYVRTDFRERHKNRRKRFPKQIAGS